MSVVAEVAPVPAPTVPDRARPPAVDVVDLVREFNPRKGPPVRALDGLSLRIAQGEVHGMLGPNGAGKTTLVKILATVLLPTSGHAAICGHDVVTAARAVRPLIGVVFGGDRGLYTRLTGRQNLEFWGAVQKVPARMLRARCDTLLHRLGLADKADRRVETYSRGMRQRLHLARGLVSDARVLFLDEPTIGMDPLAAREFRVLIDEIRGEDRTIVLATHDMAEAEALCDRVSFVRDGTVIATRSPRALADLAADARGVEFHDPDPATVAALRARPGVVSVDIGADGGAEGGADVGADGGAAVARVRVAAEDDLPGVLRALADHGRTSVRTLRPTLEDVYVRLIGDRGLEV